jgi:hypothetical protein
MVCYDLADVSESAAVWRSFAIYATSERSLMPQHDGVSAVFLMCCRVGRLRPDQAILFTLFKWLSWPLGCASLPAIVRGSVLVCGRSSVPYSRHLSETTGPSWVHKSLKSEKSERPRSVTWARGTVDSSPGFLSDMQYLLRCWQPRRVAPSGWPARFCYVKQPRLSNAGPRLGNCTGRADAPMPIASRL